MSHSSVDATLFSLILVVCCILNFLALSHIIYKFYGRPNKKISNVTKSVVMLSIILLTIHCLTHTIFQLIEHTSYGIILTPFVCQFGVIIISVSFYIGKSGLLCFYIIRAGISLKGSDIEYSNKQISFYCITVIILFGIISAIGWPIIQLPFTHPTKDSDGNYYCIVSAAAEQNYNYHHANTYFLIYASLIEILLSIWCVWLFVGRLTRRSFNTYLRRSASYEQNVGIKNSINHSTMTCPLSDDEEDDIDININLNINSLDELDFNNNDHVQIWYKATKEMNKTLLIITKLLLLLIVSIITSQIALILFLSIVPRAYGMDSCVNVYCIYLSLGFTNKIWNNLFCGNQCIGSCFPLIKMWTLTKIEIIINCGCCRNNIKGTLPTMDPNDSHQSQDISSPNVTDLDANKNKCKCSFYDRDQRRMHKMIKREYQLFIA